MNELFSSALQHFHGVGVTALVGTVLALAAVIPAAAQQPPEQTTRTLRLDASQLGHLHSRISDGRLSIEGVSDHDEVVVEALIFHYDEADIIFSLEAIHEEARLEAGFIGGSYSGLPLYMDVKIRVPVHFSVDVRHGDGDIEVAQLERMLTIESGVGDIQVNDVGGVRIEHRSGGRVSTQNIHGPVRISQRR